MNTELALGLLVLAIPVFTVIGLILMVSAKIMDDMAERRWRNERLNRGRK